MCNVGNKKPLAMSTLKSVSDPKTLFERWFERAISQLEKLENGDGGTAGMMVVLPLFERYITILTNNSTSGLKFYDIMASELQVADALQAETFWTTFRHGFCHTGMPLERGRKIAILPKVAFAAEYSSRPEFRTTPGGKEVICLDPWKFIHWVMDKYRHDPTLLTQHADAPLLAIHAIA